MNIVIFIYTLVSKQTLVSYHYKYSQVADLISDIFKSFRPDRFGCVKVFFVFTHNLVSDF